MQKEKKQQSIANNIKMLCSFGVIGTLPYLLLSASEVSYMVGNWYVIFLVLSTLATWVSLFATWYLKKAGVVAYTAMVAITTSVVHYNHPNWSSIFFILPIVLVLALWFNFKKLE